MNDFWNHNVHMWRRCLQVKQSRWCVCIHSISLHRLLAAEQQQVSCAHDALSFNPVITKRRISRIAAPGNLKLGTLSPKNFEFHHTDYKKCARQLNQGLNRIFILDRTIRRSSLFWVRNSGFRLFLDRPTVIVLRVTDVGFLSSQLGRE